MISRRRTIKSRDRPRGADIGDEVCEMGSAATVLEVSKSTWVLAVFGMWHFDFIFHTRRAFLFSTKLIKL